MHLLVNPPPETGRVHVNRGITIYPQKYVLLVWTNKIDGAEEKTGLHWPLTKQALITCIAKEGCFMVEISIGNISAPAMVMPFPPHVESLLGIWWVFLCWNHCQSSEFISETKEKVGDFRNASHWQSNRASLQRELVNTDRSQKAIRLSCLCISLRTHQTLI